MTAHIVFCTVPDAAIARTIAGTVVEEGLAACGNIVPGMTSIYRWQGNVEEAAEALIIFKTTLGAWPRLEERIIELHPYEVPELLLVRIEAGHAPYLNWVEESTQSVIT
ncbi:MAG: divalent-cation tolerance protein CutA [Pseudomonas sp.]